MSGHTNQSAGQPGSPAPGLRSAAGGAANRPGPMLCLLIGLPTLAVFVSTLGLVLAAGGAGDLVRDDYYKAGLVIQQDLTRELRAQQLGLQAVVKVSGRRVELHSTQALPNELTMVFVHPAWAREDRTVRLARVPLHAPAWDGQHSKVAARWAGELAAALPSSTWEVVLEAEGAAWRLRARSRLPGQVLLGGAQVARRADVLAAVRPGR